VPLASLQKISSNLTLNFGNTRAYILINNT
jgi:hypothetical protein